MFQLYIVIHAGAFKIYFAAVVMVLGGVSLLTNQKLYRFLVKPRFEFVIFPQFRSRLSVCGALPETAECLDDFETTFLYIAEEEGIPISGLKGHPRRLSLRIGEIVDFDRFPCDATAILGKKLLIM